MRKALLGSVLLWVLAALAPPAGTLHAQMGGWRGDPWARPVPGAYAAARVWLEDERDVFRRGERLPVRFSTTADAYVAVIHVDSEGTLDFLFPATPWDDGFVRGGRAYSLPRGGLAGWTVRGRPGIGYLYIVASPEPLDYRHFGGRYGTGWDWSYAGRAVQGDPFWALEQITRLLVPEWSYTPYVADVFSYYVEGRHRYPAYACADPRWDRGAGWGWTPYYGSCDRVDGFLRQHPGYYDTRLYRGDRRAYFRDYERAAPRHGYKEHPDRGPAGERRPLPLHRDPRREPEGTVRVPAAREGVGGERGSVRREPQRRRPSPEKRDTSGSGAAARGEPGEAASRGGRAGGYVRPQSPPPATPRRRPAGGSGA